MIHLQPANRIINYAEVSDGTHRSFPVIPKIERRLLVLPGKENVNININDET